jgi:carbon monoxide dehydrogenase subunit G
MSSGSGRFTAAIASSMARSFVGDHTIYPEVFQGHSATSSMSLTVHLTSDSGDPYAYLTNILVPLFFILGMALPQLSSNNASAYTFPPVIQCNIPGMWGTRLGMIESVNINKNPSGKDVSINGYPLQVDVTINVKDLQHVLMSSPMNKVSTFLNNHTMFDYIAQISGVDKYRVNGSMRTVARLALAASAVNNTFNNISNALMTDWHSLVNKVRGYDRQ